MSDYYTNPYNPNPYTLYYEPFMCRGQLGVPFLQDVPPSYENRYLNNPMQNVSIPTYNNNLMLDTNNNFMKTNNAIRKLWEQHVFWTKIAITSIARDSRDAKFVSERLLRNANDFGDFFLNFYPPEIAKKFSNLLLQHLLIAADLVVAAKKQNVKLLKTIESKWYKNADEIAKFLSSINPHWNYTMLQKMMYEHLALTKAEAVAILKNKYEESISLFDKIEKQALEMADDYTKGLIEQFPDKFR